MFWAVPEFELLQDVVWEGYEKIDGTNIRVILDFYEDGTASMKFGGRTEKSQMPVRLFDKLNEIFNLEKLLNTFPEATSQVVCTFYTFYT